MNTTKRSLLWALGAILIVAAMFGGGGSRYGLANLAVQLTAIAALALHGRAFVAFWIGAAVPLRILVALSLLLPALFIVPLPQSVWSALPGRELVAQSFELAGVAGWATASVEPVRTLLALTALITPLAVLVIGLGTGREQLIDLGWIVVGLGLANVAIGMVQVLSNGATGLFYPEIPMPGVLFGSFANRNTAGLFLVLCLSLAALLPIPRRMGTAAFPARIAVCVLLLLAVLLTRSRTAIVLSALPLGALALQMMSRRLKETRKRSGASQMTVVAAIGAGVLVLGAVATLAVGAPGRLGEVVDRFQEDGTDARAYIWEDSAYSASRYWPVGAGTGTFDDVFQIDESLENITLRRAGRAHNDYLEVAIEAGLSGLLLIAGWLALLAWLSWRARTSPDRWIAWSGSIALLAIALQSITDYPLRNQSMLAFAAFTLVLLVRFSIPPRGTRL
ncbi:O-antigen ligase family protein [Qipengyuania sp. S6317L1]|uniref:O-antigen ligase family protein n=1 Tax=Qipengyuania sp. S6317L1 TaxID=2926410 RepID=UPI001FF41376|nr:O-antigen ligase family protein [Qipengyuania sp. S6317L1]MCK0098779.1 O-antigen ligase family protein [Qipengyuania sp. S6317L1]